MRIVEALRTRALDVSWPVAVDGSVFSGSVAVSEICQSKCPAMPACADARFPEGEHVCNHGMSFYRSRIGAIPITVFGVKGKSNQPNGNRLVKAALKGRNAGPLHDPARLAKQIEAIASRILEREQPNLSEEARLERADNDTKSLLKAARLLNDI